MEGELPGNLTNDTGGELMRSFPDFHLELINSTDYILGSPLGRRALASSRIPDMANLLRDLLDDMDRLAKNCHLPEFTDHSLPHICSLVRRLSDWGTRDGWLSTMTSEEAAFLLLATLCHDLGMLSQDPSELEGAVDQTPKGMAELSDWVRRTHVPRLGGLLKNLFRRRQRAEEIDMIWFSLVVALGKAHAYWPWQAGFTTVEQLAAPAGIDARRARGLAALIAVADLLDEDASRCDTDTLFKHRMGTTINRAHWLRHGLTLDRIDVLGRTVAARFVNVPGAPSGMEQVFRALRNHLRLVLLYNDDLKAVGAEITHLNFDPCTGVPAASNEALGAWKDVDDFTSCLAEQLLTTFMPEALNDVRDSQTAARLTAIGLELVDLTAYRAFNGRGDEQLTDEERIFFRHWYRVEV